MLAAAQVSSRLLAALIHPASRRASLDWRGYPASGWEDLARRAESEGVAPLLHWRFEAEGWPGEAPEAFRSRLGRAYYASAAQNALLFAELQRVCEALARRQIPTLLLKGSALATCLYPDPALRPMTDLDVLAPRGWLEPALQALHEQGYTEIGSEITPGINKWLSYNVELRSARSNAVVELHWALVAGDFDWRTAPLDWFWGQTCSLGELAALGGSQAPGGLLAQARGLSPTAHLLYLAAHLFLRHPANQHRLIWFYDLDLLARRWGGWIDWELLALKAAELGWAPALSMALNGAQQRFDTPLPEGWLEGLAKLATPDQDTRTRRMGRQASTRSLSTWREVSALPWRQRALVLLSLAFPRPAYLRWRYRPRPGWLWPLYYPYRWLDIAGDALATMFHLAGRPQRPHRE